MAEALAAASGLQAPGLGLGVASNANVAKIAIEQRRKPALDKRMEKLDGQKLDQKTDVVEPEVISEEHLIRGVQEPERPDLEPWDPIDFPQVTSLVLHFQNIIEISNLNNFDSLTTLRLDNNIIDKIANLDHLQNLTWLDLSFNNIREIEGLNKLYKLLDLSLYHNQISEIKGLDDCPNLNILSLGHNYISELKQIDYLRKFQNLRCVCLDGNKVCTHDSYLQHVLAYLTNLKYLDYMLIDRKTINNAQDSYNLDELTEVKEREQASQQKIRQEEEKRKVLEKLKESFLDCTEDLFEQLFSKEVEPEHVLVLQCYGTLKEEYRDKLTEDIAHLKKTMEEKNESRLKKTSAFEKSIKVAEKESEEEAFQMVKDFKAVKKKVLAKLDKEEHKAEAKRMEEHLLDDLGELEDHLMANEIQLQESIEEAISDFETSMQKLTKDMQEKGTEFFRKLDDHEKGFNLSVTDAVTSEIDTFTQLSDTAHAEDPNKAKYLGNREEMQAACSNFHEAHLKLITDLEDYFNNQVQAWRTSFFERHREAQYHRNRQRIMDTKKVIDDCRDEIKAAIEAGEDDYDHDNAERY
jgi:hypothetical protein